MLRRVRRGTYLLDVNEKVVWKKLAIGWRPGVDGESARYCLSFGVSAPLGALRDGELAEIAEVSTPITGLKLVGETKPKNKPSRHDKRIGCNDYNPKRRIF